MSAPELEWHRVAAPADLVEGRPLGVTVGDRSIGLYRLDGALHALDDICTHEFAILSDGYVEDGCIECPLHQALFDIRTGEAQGPPANGDLATYPVRVEGEDVLVGVPKG